MEKKDLLKTLEDISNDMDNFLGDSALQTAVKDFNKIKDKVDTLIGELENEEGE